MNETDELKEWNAKLTGEFIECKKLLEEFREKLKESKDNIKKINEEIKKMSKLIRNLRAEYTKKQGEIFTSGLVHDNLKNKEIKLNARFRKENPIIWVKGKKTILTEENYSNFDDEISNQAVTVYLKKEMLKTDCNVLQTECDNAFELRTILKRQLAIEIEITTNCLSNIEELEKQMQEISGNKIESLSCLENTSKSKLFVKKQK